MMVRVHDRHGLSAPSAAVLHRRAAPKQKTPYKVIFEEVGGKQKKLKTLLHGDSKPPEGYTFIPAGDPQLTSRCKNLAKEEGLTVYIVSTSIDPAKPLSRETHRLGYHFPSVTVAKACDSLGVTLTRTGRVLDSHLAALDEGGARSNKSSRPTKKKQKPGGRNETVVFDIDSLSQAQIDTQAREALKDLFPNIPGEDLHVIIGRSFQKGKGLVGTAKDVTLVRRAQLAVIAHIRHVYTDYDKLLRIVTWQDARSLVEQATLDKLIQWRGDEDYANDINEILREVIVIPDDDDDDEEIEEKDRMIGNSLSVHERLERDNSVEILSAENLQTQAIDYGSVDRPGHTGRIDSPNSDDVEIVHYRGRPSPYRGQQRHYNQHKQDQMEAHRHRRWEEARDRRRNETIYMVDDNAVPPEYRTFEKGLNYQSKLEYQQPYTSETSHQVTEAASFQTSPAVYTELIPLPRDKASNYIVESCGGGRQVRKEANNRVMYPTEQNRILPSTRRLAESNSDHYTNEARTYPPSPYQSDLQRPSSKGFQQGARFVRPHNPVHAPNDGPLGYSSQHQVRRRSEVVLPSVEGGSSTTRDQQGIYDARQQQVNQFAFGELTSGGLPHRMVPSEGHSGAHNGPLYTRKRKYYDRQPLDTYGHNANTNRPFDNGAGKLGTDQTYFDPKNSDTQPPSAGHDHLLPFSPDDRIVQLPSKDMVGYQGGQGHMPSGSHSDSTENQLIYRVPRKHIQIPLPGVGLSRQPQSHLHSKFTQPIYDHESPDLSNVSKAATAYHETLESSSTSRRASGMGVADERTFISSYAVTEHPSRLESPARKIQSPFQNLAIHDRRRRELDYGIRQEQKMVRTNYEPTQHMYTLSRPHHDAYMLGPEQGPGRVVMENPSHSREPRSVQPAHHIYDGSLQTRDQSFEGSSRYMEPNITLAPTQPFESRSTAMINPFGRRSTQTVLGNAKDQWKQQAESWEQPPYRHAAGEGISHGSSSSHQENIRPSYQDFNGSRPLEKRAPKEVIVLE